MKKNKLKNVKKLNKPSVILPTEDSKELLQIKQIVHIALTRILTGKTKKTYQQELHLISTTIKDYIDITYMPIVEHENELLESLFKLINYFKEKHEKTGNFKLTIEELEKISEGGDNE